MFNGNFINSSADSGNPMYSSATNEPSKLLSIETTIQSQSYANLPAKIPPSMIPTDTDEIQKNSNAGAKDTGRIKRPMNGFMVWSRAQRKLIQVKHPKMHNSVISKLLGALWRGMKDEEKKIYLDEAKKLQEDHQREHPNYRYKPKKKAKKAKENVKIASSICELTKTSDDLSTPATSLVPSARYRPYSNVHSSYPKYERYGLPPPSNLSAPYSPYSNIYSPYSSYNLSAFTPTSKEVPSNGGYFMYQNPWATRATPLMTDLYPKPPQISSHQQFQHGLPSIADTYSNINLQLPRIGPPPSYSSDRPMLRDTSPKPDWYPKLPQISSRPDAFREYQQPEIKLPSTDDTYSNITLQPAPIGPPSRNTPSETNSQLDPPSVTDTNSKITPLPPLSGPPSFYYSDRPASRNTPFTFDSNLKQPPINPRSDTYTNGYQQSQPSLSSAVDTYSNINLQQPRISPPFTNSSGYKSGGDSSSYDGSSVGNPQTITPSPEKRSTGENEPKISGSNYFPNGFNSSYWNDNPSYWYQQLQQHQ